MGRRFKALVTHDGVTNTLADYATEELWFINHDQGGIFTSPNETSTYYRWNPILFYENWATPHFVVHNDLDYRLPVSEGIMLFNMLQVKGVPTTSTGTLLLRIGFKSTPIVDEQHDMRVMWDSARVSLTIQEFILVGGFFDLIEHQSNDSFGF
ncbi:MAG: hypothetical protein Q9192_007388 [Flavoplaca navasiana]